MAATQSDVNNYISYIRYELATYGNKLATMHQQGNKPSFSKEVKFMLLQAFVDIAETYLGEWDGSGDNLMTVSEFEDIMKHINRICNSEYWLELE